MTAAVTAILDFNFTTAPPPTVLLDISTQSVPLKNSVKTSGTNTINEILATETAEKFWQAGSVIHLQFDELSMAH